MKHPAKKKILSSESIIRDKTFQQLERIKIKELISLYPYGYQLECFYTALIKITLICLPTGTGNVHEKDAISKRKKALCLLGSKNSTCSATEREVYFFFE